MSKFSCAQLRIKETENRTTNSLDELQEIANQCFNNKLKELHTFNAFTLKLDPDTFPNDNKDIITVQRIEVILHGAHTRNRVLRLYLASTGVYQLRVNKEIYTTFEDTLLQELAYDISPNPPSQQQQSSFGGPIDGRVMPPAGSIVNQPASLRSEISLADVNKVKSDINTFEETVNELKDSILRSEESLNSSINDDDDNNTKRHSSSEDISDSNNNNNNGDSIWRNYGGVSFIPKYRMELNKPLLTTWVVIVPKEMNPGLNVKNVKKITVKIVGTFRSYVRKNVMVL